MQSLGFISNIATINTDLEPSFFVDNGKFISNIATINTYKQEITVLQSTFISNIATINTQTYLI